ncbi:MAG: XdhC/CoxI family protein [Firmicutes bacterium]|jgi:xanthine dehydrogenase accessory factor|nr:XdhC/CoxI family protein [Bacillota bacterium]
MVGTIEILERLVETVKSGSDAALVTVVSARGSSPGREGFKMVVVEGGKTFGTVGGGPLEAAAIKAGLDAIAAAASSRVSLGREQGGLAALGMACGGEVELLVEYVSAGPRAYIFGAGHVGLAVGELAKFAGFGVTLIDDREEFANRDLAPWADRIVVSDFQEAALSIPGGLRSYAVIVTRGHEWDEVVLETILSLPEQPFYVGMIGSRRKVRECFANLEARRITKNALARVHAPIGLDIGGVTPREIAVSVVAEMVAARYGRDPRHTEGE